jgi:hypothetical protein
MQILIPKLIFGVIYMLFSEILLWVVAILFIIGIVMTLEKRLSSVIGLFLVCVTSIFFVYYFTFSKFLALCVMFAIVSLIAVRYLISEFK